MRVLIYFDSSKCCYYVSSCVGCEVYIDALIQEHFNCTIGIQFYSYLDALGLQIRLRSYERNFSWTALTIHSDHLHRVPYSKAKLVCINKVVHECKGLYALVVWLINLCR